MKREIKFRLWVAEARKFYHLPDLQGKNHSVCGTEGSNQYEYVQWNIYSATPAVWQQFTGLKDKNGKEIYEGDFVKMNESGGDNCFGVVVFESGAFRVQETGEKDLADLGYNETFFEVIGNIFENPELPK